jgi:hypothetical protein
VAGQNPATIFIQIKIKRMANMSYCRFENTLRDLRDCYDNMDSDDLSKSEFYARKQMIELCIVIASEYEDLLDEEWSDDDEAREWLKDK